MRIPKIKCALGALCSEKYVIEAYREAAIQTEKEKYPTITSSAFKIQDMTDEKTFLVSVVIARQEDK
jgi:hypothetical protein